MTAMIGYARVSKADGSQLHDLQRDALITAGVLPDHIYEDSASGRRDDRPGLEACVKALRAGDTLAVWKLDRLGRNTRHVLEVIDQLTKHGIGFRSVTEGITTEGAMGRAMLTIMSAFAELERDTMVERTRAGLASAAANGRKGGRPHKLDEAQAARARELRGKGMTATEVGKVLGCSRATVYRYLAADAQVRA